jgi:predicted helicase
VNTADGMRKTLAEEFTTIHVLNLRDNQRTAGEQSRKEGGKVFGGGSRATVAATVLVKSPDRTAPAVVHYTDVGDYLTREEKLAKVAEAGGLAGLEPATLTPNDHGDWLNQRRSDFDDFVPLGNKTGGERIFSIFSGGVKTQRWSATSSGQSTGSTILRKAGQLKCLRPAN